MLQQVFNAAQLATLPADKLIDLTDQREGYFRLINLSPHCFEIWDENAVIRGVAWPWNPAWVAIGKAARIEGIIIHGLATLGVAPDAGAQKVLYEVTTLSPPPMPFSQPPYFEINGANKAALLTNVSVSQNAPGTRLDSGQASRKSIRVTNPASNANAIFWGYATGVTTTDPPVAGNPDGVKLPPGNSVSIGLGPGLQLWARAAVAATVVSVEELS